MARRLERFEGYRHRVEREVCRLVACDTGTEPQQIGLIQPERGVSTLTFFVDCDGRRSYVLRCLLRRREIGCLPQIYAFCDAKGLPVPVLRGQCVGFWGRLRVGFHLLLEEFVQAEPVEKVLNEHRRRDLVLDALARGMARFHDVTRTECGPVVGSRARNYLSYYVNKARQKLERIQETVPEIPRGTIEKVDRFLLEEFRDFRRATLYSLVHGDPSDGNVLVDEDNRVTWVDLENVHFGISQYDLQMVRHYLLGDDETVYLGFRKAYDGWRQNRADESARLDILCRVFVLLRSLRVESPSQRDEHWWGQWREIAVLAGGKESHLSGGMDRVGLGTG